MSDKQSLTVQVRQLGHNKLLVPQYQIPMPINHMTRQDEPMTLRQLVTRIVHYEVDRFHARQAELQLMRVLTPHQIESGRVRGRIDPAAKEHLQTVHVEDAVRAAHLAFEDGLYFVFIDGDQKLSLEEAIQLEPNSALEFIRLVALAGG